MLNHASKYRAVLALAVAGGLVGCTTDSTSTEGKRASQSAAKLGSAKPVAGKPAATSGEAAAKPSGEAASPRSSLPQLKGPHHAVFRLLDNRALGHLIHRGGLLIAAGRAGAAKYMNFGRPWRTWKLNAKLDGQRVALATRPVSWLSFPLDETQAAAKQLVMRIKSPGAQGVRVVLNDVKLPPIKVSEGWQRAQLALPARALHPGENRLALHWNARGQMAGERAYAALQWLDIAVEAPAEQPRLTIEQGKGMMLRGRDGVAYYVHPYSGAKLRLRFSAQPAAQRCSLSVTLRARGGKPTVVERTETALEKGSVETYVDLAPLADKTGRLDLQATGSSCREVALADAAIVMPGKPPAIKRGSPPKNVLFWLIDNARADRYKLYNPETRVETPVITKLGRTGTVFLDAYINGTESRVSHASLWTGLYPKQHRFIGPKSKLAASWVTLPEAMLSAGFYTAAWTANGNISRFWGFGQGWRSFRNTLHKGGGLSGKALADHAIKFLSEHGSERFYLYIGTIDAHVSWRGRQPWLGKYDPDPYSGKYRKTMWGRDWDKLAGNPKRVSARDRKRIRAIYDSTISYNDQQLGRVLAALDELGIRDQTMIVVTADHGEELWEYGRIGHGGSLKNTVVDVPLIVHYPPLFGSGVRVREGVDAGSVMATILDAVGAPIPKQVQMASLLPLAQGVGRGYPRPAMASQYELAHTMRVGNLKLRVGGKGHPRLYDLSSKRKEAEDIAPKRPYALRWLTDALSTFLTYQSRWRQSRWGVATNLKAAFADDLENGTAPPRITR